MVSCEVQQAIKIKGSDTEVNLTATLAESFHEVNNAVLISVSGGGSGLGITSLYNQACHLANSSREMSDEERNLFYRSGVEIDSFIFAHDAIAFVVSGRLPLDSINLSDLGKLLNGEYNNWNHLCNTNLPVTIYGRQSNSGTFDFVRNQLGIRFSPKAKQMNGNAQILEAIKADHSGIGYVGAGYVKGLQSDRIKVLKIIGKDSGAYSPLDSSAVVSGKYLFKRPLIQYFQKSDFNKLKDFLEFEQSVRGQQIIQSSGYFPVIN